MRKFMTKEVTTTTITLAKMQMVDGQPQAEKLEDEILVGNVSLEKAQQHAVKKHGAGVTVFTVEPQTHVYELSVEDFIKVAAIKK
jgi:Histone-like Protein p6